MLSYQFYHPNQNETHAHVSNQTTAQLQMTSTVKPSERTNAFFKQALVLFSCGCEAYRCRFVSQIYYNLLDLLRVLHYDIRDAELILYEIKHRN